MSYVRHYATIFTTTRLELAQDIWQEAVKLFKHLPPVFTSLDELHHSVFIPPYDSFNSASPAGTSRQSRLIWWLSYERSQGEETGVAWVQVQYGDDNLVTEVVSHSCAATRKDPSRSSSRISQAAPRAGKSKRERYHAILVTSHDAAILKQAIRQAQQLSLPVSPFNSSRTDYYRSFCIPPDPCPGSKQAREAFITWLQGLQSEEGSSPLDWVAVEYGGGRPARIARHSDEIQAARLARELEQREAASTKTFRLTLHFTVNVPPLTDEAAHASLKRLANYTELANNPDIWANIDHQRALLKVLRKNPDVFAQYLRNYMLVLMQDCPLSIAAEPDSIPDIHPHFTEKLLLPLLKQLPPDDAQFYREVIAEGLFSDQVMELHDCLQLRLEETVIEKSFDDPAWY